MLDRALQRPDASGLVIDLAAIEEAGFGSRDEGLRQTAELLTSTIPWLAASEDDPELRQFFGRFTVSTAILQEWTDWPNVRGLAVSIPDVAIATKSEGAAVASAVVVLAIAQDEQNNRQLLEGVMALGRASLAEEHGQKMKFELRGGDACVVDPGGSPFCVRSGNGFLLMGTPEAMSGYQAAAVPAREAMASAAGATEAQAEPVLVHARISMRQQGTANLFIRGKERLALFASVESQSPMLLRRAEQVVNEQVAKYDERRASQRQLLTETLARMKAQLEADPQAPARMKQIASALTPDKVIDPHGYWQQTRASLKTEQVGQRYSVSLVVPVAAVEELQRSLEDGGGTSVAVVGVLSAIAIPNFVKFQCRAKQSEPKANLATIVTRQRTFAAEKGKYGRTFGELGFTTEDSSRYVYCMGQECTGCTSAECVQVHGENPCAGLSGVGKSLQDGFQVCAYGNLDSDPGLDIWVVDDRGAPENGENDCAN